ncbi:MAG: hypothetical protein SFH39_12220 [Candidatus Magnetobacterium sp. LHC-1]
MLSRSCLCSCSYQHSCLTITNRQANVNNYFNM